MKILIFGKTGQVARELFRRCPPHVEAVFLGREGCDLAHPQSAGSAIRQWRPDAVINSAAWTAVDQAEAEEAAARLVNAAAPAAMAAACGEAGIPLLHLSTEYVFDGHGSSAFSPGDSPAPLNAYGRTKLAGEEAIRSSGAHHLILRTSGVFSAHGSNFVKSILNHARKRDVLQVVADQIGGPTSAASLADALFTAAQALRDGQTGGTHHLAGAPDVSRAEFARIIVAEAGIPCRIEDVPSSHYPLPARRPLNSRLDCSGFEGDFGVPRPDWRGDLAECLRELEGRL